MKSPPGGRFRLRWRPLVYITNYTFNCNELQITQISPKWIYTVLKIFSSFTIFEQLALALKKQSCPEVSLYWIYFLPFRIFNNLRLPWKRSLPWNCSLYWIYVLPFRIFEQLCPCPEKQCALKFHCVKHTFCIQDFWANCACPENSYPGIFHCIEIFFIVQDLSNLRLPWKQSLPWIFSSPGDGRPPRLPPRTPMTLPVCGKIVLTCSYSTKHVGLSDQSKHCWREAESNRVTQFNVR